jgi:hypothetical protein
MPDDDTVARGGRSRTTIGIRLMRGGFGRVDNGPALPRSSPPGEARLASYPAQRAPSPCSPPEFTSGGSTTGQLPRTTRTITLLSPGVHLRGKRDWPATPHNAHHHPALPRSSPPGEARLASYPAQRAPSPRSPPEFTSGGSETGQLPRTTRTITLLSPGVHLRGKQDWPATPHNAHHHPALPRSSPPGEARLASYPAQREPSPALPRSSPPGEARLASYPAQRAPSPCSPPEFTSGGSETGQLPRTTRTITLLSPGVHLRGKRDWPATPPNAHHHPALPRSSPPGEARLASYPAQRAPSPCSPPEFTSGGKRDWPATPPNAHHHPSSPPEFTSGGSETGQLPRTTRTITRSPPEFTSGGSKTGQLPTTRTITRSPPEFTSGGSKTGQLPKHNAHHHPLSPGVHLRGKQDWPATQPKCRVCQQHDII